MIDQFYTLPEDAKRAVMEVSSRYDLGGFDWILEPSAGGGAFLEHLPRRTLAIDLDPVNCSEEVIQCDFFDYDFPEGSGLTIGNPPFGRRGSLAVRFINLAAEYSRVVAMVLPRSFARPAMQNRVNPLMHLVHDHDISTFVLPGGDLWDVRATFQVWERRAYERVLLKVSRNHPDFRLKHQHISWATDEEMARIREEFPICIGQNNLRWMDSREPQRGSVWFVKPVSERCKAILMSLDFAYIKESSTCTPSLSKGDIIDKYTSACADKLN